MELPIRSRTFARVVSPHASSHLTPTYTARLRSSFCRRARVTDNVGGVLSAPSGGGGGGGGGGGCHPSYSPCVPTGRDYDCGELGGPYTVTGPDEYRLDGDNDGVGCE